MKKRQASTSVSPKLTPATNSPLRVSDKHVYRLAPILLCCVLLAGPASNSYAKPIGDAYDALRTSYQQEVQALTTQLDQAGQTDAAARAAHWLPALPAQGVLLFSTRDLPAAAKPLPPSDPLTPLRQRQAVALYQLAEQAAQAGESALAMQLTVEALREDPNHAAARNVLGYESAHDQWLLPQQLRFVQRGLVWHDEFGWINGDDVENFQTGQRPFGRRWISTAEDAARRERIEAGWIIKTEHYLVKTNESLRSGVDLAERLETLYSLWQQLFAAYWLESAQVANVFAGSRHLPTRRRPMQVWQFKNREQYIEHLRRDQPQIGITLGIYFDTHRRAYFFAGEEQHAATIFHEASHQLFQEMQPAARNVGRLDNMWIVEGIATYFESLQVHDDPHAGRYYTLGEANAGRLAAARERLLVDNYYVPFARLVRIGKLDLQTRSDIRSLYSQIAGQATFLMHGQHGAYRRPLVEYLAAVYRNRADAKSLSKFTQQDYESLDVDYREFLEQPR